MIPQFNFIILDIIVVLVLILFAVFGSLKGIKQVLIDLVLFIGSALLSFSSLTNFIKLPIINLAFSTMPLGAGANDTTKLALSISYFFIASLIFMLLIYLLAITIKYIIRFFIKRNALKNNKLIKYRSVLERVFGGVVNFIISGSFAIILLSVVNTPLFGLNKTTNESLITKYVIQFDDIIFYQDELYEAKLCAKLLKGDVFVKVDEQDAQVMNKVLSTLEKESILVKDVKDLQEGLDSIYNILLFVEMNCLDENGNVLDGYKQAVEITKNLVTKSINHMNDLRENQDRIDGMKNIQAIHNLLRKFNLNDIDEIFTSMFVNS